MSEVFKAVQLDDEGNPVELVNLVTICPADRIAEGRELSLAFLQSHDLTGDTDAKLLFPDPLSPDGTGEATHWMCSRVVNPKEEQLQTKWESSGVADWFNGSVFTLSDDPEAIKARFGHFNGDTAEFLAFIGLVRMQ